MFVNFHLKDFVVRMLRFEKISFENFILLKDVSLITFVIVSKVLCH